MMGSARRMRHGKSNFTLRAALCHAPAIMRMDRSLLMLLLLAASLVGCTSTTITNLTATTQPRTPTNLYRIEYQWDTTQQSIRDETIQPYVIVGFEAYPMTRVLHTNNRWEAFVPLPPGRTTLVYTFKVDYEFNRFGQPGKGSKLSPEYRLVVK